ncbi:hypothetical protein [Jatrophihabitans fulvus]
MRKTRDGATPLTVARVLRARDSVRRSVQARLGTLAAAELGPLTAALSPATLKAAGLTMRVFADSPPKLPAAAAQEILDALRASTPSRPDVPTIAVATQSLVYSGHSRATADVLIGVLADPRAGRMPLQVRRGLRSALDVCLYETFRQGESLHFDDAEAILASLEARLHRFAQQVLSHGTGLKRADRTRLRTLAEACLIAVPMVNSAHQAAAARLLEVYLKIVGATGAVFVDDDYLPTLLRKCTTTTRVFFAIPELDALRVEAQLVAKAMHVGDELAPSQRTIGQRALAYRYLLAAGDVEQQRRELSAIRDEAVSTDSPDLWSLAVNCLSWTLETTLDPAMTLFAEDLFFNVPTPTKTHQYLAMSIRFGDEKRGREWIDTFAKVNPTPNSRYLEARFHLAFGDSKAALAAARKPLSVYSEFHRRNPMPETRVDRLVRAPRASEPRLKSADPFLIYNIVRTAQEAAFVRDINSFVDQAATMSASELTSETPDYSRTTLVLVPNHLNFASQLPMASIEAARLAGAEVVSMVNGQYPASAALSPAAELIKDRIVPGFYCDRARPSSALSPDWELDPDHRKMVYHGLNYYYGVHNSLGIQFRRFSIDFHSLMESAHVTRLLAMVQNVHELMHEFFQRIDPQRRYVFVTIGVQAGLGWVVREQVTAAKLPNVRVVHAANGFETFDRQFETDEWSGNPYASYHSARDMTDLPDTPLCFRPARSEVAVPLFDREDDYLAANPVVRDYVAKIDGRVARARATTQEKPRTGRRVLVLGTILPDLSIPHDRGLVHVDIADWVRHTYEVAREHGVTLVVKQHPAEANDRFGFFVSERFVELFPSTEGIELLPYDSDFAQSVLDCDLVVIWSGTSVLELSMMGADYVACSRFANEEYAVSTEPFATREEYAALLVGDRKAEPLADGRLRSIDIIHRITTSPMRERSANPRRQLLNGHVWPPRLFVDDALEQLKDPGTWRLAERVVASTGS